jgi:alpha-glucoside transport system substrate-binding protein
LPTVSAWPSGSQVETNPQKPNEGNFILKGDYMSKKKGLLVGAAIAALSLVATVFTTTSAKAADCADYAQFGKFNNATVKVFAGIRGVEATTMQDIFKQFTACTGITIAYEGTDQFETLLPVRVKGGNAPDLAIIPQPGLVATMVATGKAVPISAATRTNLNSYYNPAWKSFTTINGRIYGAPLGASSKSLVWYSPAQFKKLGVTVPKTWAEMEAVAAKFKAAGANPWCAGIFSGAATGWPATDWVEEMALRELGPKKYNMWWQGKLKFSSDEMQGVMNKVAAWLGTSAQVGDLKSVATRKFEDAGNPGIVKGTCGMLQQASFYASFFDKGTTFGPTGDVDAFYLPATNAKFGNPVEGAGEFPVAFSTKKEVGAVQAYLASPVFGTARAAAGGWTSANTGIPIDTYKDPVLKAVATQLQNKSGAIVFDASDLMPTAVNGAFWKEITKFYAEGKSMKDVAAAIDANW